MISKILIKNLCFFILLSFLFSNNSVRLKKNITSLLNTTDIDLINNDILVSTEGGIYSINNEDYHEFNTYLSDYDISCISKDFSGNFWIGSKTLGIIQIFDQNFNHIKNIVSPSFNQIIDIDFTNDYAYSIVLNELNEYIVVQYEINSMEYITTIKNFPITYTKINDIEIDDSKIFIATNNGLLTADYLNNEGYLSFSNQWTNICTGNINSLYIADVNLYTIQDDIFDLTCQVVGTEPNNEDIIQLYSYGNVQTIYALTSNTIYQFDSGTGSFTFKFAKLNGINQPFNNHFYLNAIHYIGLQNNGVQICSEGTNLCELFIPNTIFKNQFDALSLYDGNLLGVVNHQENSGQSGGFVYNNVLLIQNNSNQVYNFYSYESYKINDYPTSESYFKADTLNYWSGDKTASSAVYYDGLFYFPNSGTYDDMDMSYYHSISGEDPAPGITSYDFSTDITPPLQYGGLVAIDITDEFNFELFNVWSMLLLDGLNGINDVNETDAFITINQILLDNNNNLLIVNPYAERTNPHQPFAIILDNSGHSWFHVQDVMKARIPQEVAFDKYNNLWIAYKEDETVNEDGKKYSPGGIQMVEIKDVRNINDDRWHRLWVDKALDELDEINVWSIDIGYDRYNNEILWILSDLGVQGYILYTSYSEQGIISVNFQKISNNFYFSNLSLQEGNKIRVDKQNNAWITTKNDGLRIIKNNGEVWTSYNRNEINNNNFSILSDNIYDVIFDDFGNVYIATEKGISILETSFSKDVSPENISVSPNPFRIGIHNELIITNIPKYSIVKIMNLSGLVVKEFNVTEEDRIFSWEGTDYQGKHLETGVYLVSIYNSSGGTGVTKLAIIH